MSYTELHTSANRRTAFYLLLIASILSIPVHSVHPQTPDGEPEPWEDWTLDSLDVEDFEAIDSGMSNEVIHLSRGFFATPSPGASIEFMFPFFYNGVFDDAVGLRSGYIAATAEPFGSHDPYDCPFIDFGECNEKKILEPGTNNEVEDGFPKTGFAELGFRLSYHLPVPGVAHMTGAYRHTEGILYSEDTSRAYLSYDGLMRPFREISTLHYEAWGVSGGVGLHIPIYGAFLTTKALTLGSYYYLGGAITADYGLDNRVNQFAQIADAKDQIRYGNEQDTTVLFRGHQPDGFRRFRTSYEVQIGWRLAAEVISLGIEAFVSIPRESLLEDAEWREYYGGLRMNIGYLWGTGVLWR